ncbi:hypothetical protein [Nitrosomonas communis]|uniref:hypothetical protein n=1 Tax=Nitrosomonas communis TaxID=44574 RepID=UPI003D299A3E
MNKNLKDILIHGLAAILITVFIMMLPDKLAIAVMLALFWYGWELGQRVARDDIRQGSECLLYWFNIMNWSNQARLEFLVPANLSLLAYLIFLMIAS